MLFKFGNRNSAATLTPRVVAVLIVASSFWGSLAFAQGHRRTINETAKKSLPYPPSRESSPDTGRMIPRAEWDRYITPGMCLAAARNIQHQTDRIERQESMPSVKGLSGIIKDTLATAAVAASRSCGARFAVEQVHKSELINLFILSTWMNDSTLSSAVLKRQLSFVTSAEDRGNVMRRGVELLLDARPAQLARAREFVKQIDELGPEARMARIRAYRALAQFYAERVGDFSEASRISDVMLALHPLVTQDELESGMFADDVLAPYMSKVKEALFSDPETAVAIFNEAVAGIRSLGLIEMADGLTDMGATYYECCIAKIGSPFTSLVPTRMISREGKLTTGESGGIPRPGRITVLIPLHDGWRDGGALITNFIRSVRQIDSAYGDRIDIVVFTKTAGFTPGSLSQTPTEELESIRQYFYEKNSLSASLAVYEAPIIELPDGRKIRDHVPYEAVFNGGLDFVVVDENGKFQRLMRGIIGNPFAVERVMASVLSSDANKNAPKATHAGQ